jgi:ABC-type transport system involved in Fe-S cluster assembly fused permease/ATPase subunit
VIKLFRFDKLSNLSKSVHTGENSRILTMSNKKGNKHISVIKKLTIFSVLSLLLIIIIIIIIIIK